MLLADPGSANPGLVKSAVLASPQTPGKEYYNKITHPACWIVSPDLLKKPATEGLLPYLESSSKPDNADFHSVPGKLSSVSLSPRIMLIDPQNSSGTSGVYHFST